MLVTHEPLSELEADLVVIGSVTSSPIVHQAGLPPRLSKSVEFEDTIMGFVPS